MTRLTANGHSMGRVPLPDQCQQVVNDIETALRDTVPHLSHDPRGFCFEFTIHIRDGSMQQLDTDTSDETFDTVDVQKGKSVAEGIRELTTWLLRDLRQRAVKGYHGAVIVRVRVQRDSLSFSPLVRRQRRYTWGS